MKYKSAASKSLRKPRAKAKARQYAAQSFQAWLPSTWPQAPNQWDQSLIETLRIIFNDSMLVEIDNVIKDAKGNLVHRGHVLAIALLCALDAVSSYGYGARSGAQIPDFIGDHFPTQYRQFGMIIRKIYRNAMIHSWNLFGATISSGNELPVYDARNDTLAFGLVNFRKA